MIQATILGKETTLYPVRYSIDETLGLTFMTGTLNQFHGLDVRGLQVLKSAAGYYIGSLCTEKIEGVEGDLWLPNSRDSQRYWATRDEAEEALLKNNYEVKY